MNIFNVICGVITIISLGFTIFFGIKSESLKKASRSMSWTDVLNSVDFLWKRLRQDRFHPDIIIAPGLRGCFFAELLVNKIGHDIPVFVGSSIIGAEDKQSVFESGFTKIVVNKNWNIFIPDYILGMKEAKILIVDDFTLAGQFPHDLKTLMLEEGIKDENIKVFYAVITTVVKSKDYLPDYYWKEVSDDNYFFPWGRANMG